MQPSVKNPEAPLSVLVTYRLKPDVEEQFRLLLAKHWPTLDQAGLVTKEPAKIWRAMDRQGHVAYVELFQWKNAAAPDVAHQTPEIMRVWEPMGPILETMEIQHLEPAQL